MHATRTVAIGGLLIGLLVPMPMNAQKGEVELGNARVRIRLAGQSKQWWSYQSKQGAAALEFSGPVVEIDGAPVEDTLSGLKQSGASTRLPNGVTEYRVEGVYTHHPTLHAALIFRLAAESPMVRFRYEISSVGQQKLTRAAGADRLEYFGVSLAAFPAVREVRFSEFQEATHSFTLSERAVEQKGFDNGVRLMPIGSLSPFSHFANVLGSTPSASATSSCERPSVARCRTNRSSPAVRPQSGTTRTSSPQLATGKSLCVDGCVLAIPLVPPAAALS